MILKHLLNGRQFSSFILIQDNEHNSAHHLLRRIIGDNLARGNAVHVFNHSGAAFYGEFTSNGSFKELRLFSDPWNLYGGMVGGNAVDSTSWISPIQMSVVDFNVVVIDSLSSSLLTSSLESICLRIRDLKAINDENRRTQVVGVVNMNLNKENSIEFQEINRLAESVVTLSSLQLTGEIHVVHRKSLGKRLDGNYVLTLSEAGVVDFHEKTKSSIVKEDSNPDESPPQVVTTFKLTLDDKEKESRRQVVLPYLKNTIIRGGEIIYEPDANDDWDDEDPDDDLEI